MAFPGFNNSKKRGTISNGDFDRDGKSNRRDCEPLNFRKQGPEHEVRDLAKEDDKRQEEEYLKHEKDIMKADAKLLKERIKRQKKGSGYT